MRERVEVKRYSKGVAERLRRFRRRVLTALNVACLMVAGEDVVVSVGGAVADAVAGAVSGALFSRAGDLEVWSVSLEAAGASTVAGISSSAVPTFGMLGMLDGNLTEIRGVS